MVASGGGGTSVSHRVYRNPHVLTNGLDGGQLYVGQRRGRRGETPLLRREPELGVVERVELAGQRVDQIRRAMAGHDAVVAAVKGPDRLVPKAAGTLIEAGVRRLVFVGGGGSLLDPNGQRFVDSPRFPAEYKQTALDQADALDILRRDGAAIEWSYASPPPVHLVPGERTGTYRAAARDIPITDDHGESRITAGDYASAIVDALEQRTFIRQRFTVGY